MVILVWKSLVVILLSQQLLLLVSGQDGKCPPSFECGYLGPIKFPFTTTKRPRCGLLAIHGCEEHDQYATKTVQLSTSTSRSRSYDVLKVEPRSIMFTDDEQDRYLRNKSCKAFSNDFTLPHNSSSASFNIKYSITIFRCNHSLKVTLPNYFHKYSNCSEYVIYYGYPNTETPLDFKWHSSLASCSTIQLATQGKSTDDPFQFLTASIAIGVKLSIDCERCLRDGKGQCSLDSKLNCAKAEHRKLAWKLGLGIGLSGIIIIGLLIIWHCKPRGVLDFSSNPNPESASIYFGIPVFTYKDLEIATECFDRSRELGEGGFGIVYYGKLQDGREVAVKRLHEHNNRRLEQFMNEIKILTRLRHTNLVSLYGCTSRHSRELLLVYEYISNGTVASHLHHHGSTKPGILPWPIRMKVAIETATALAYLHASDIIHRDVKTNNILLDNTFCVKVADFGVSRLFPNDVTHVSTAPQGTPGYVDPEYHSCYQLTNKSDVYSFGVVLIELISAMPPIDMTRHKDEINLAYLAVRKIQKSALAELVDPSLGFDSNSDVKRQITSMAELAFRCLQRERELRPSMDDVLEALTRIKSPKDEPEHLLPPPSPKAVTDKWDSKSTTSNNVSDSGQSLSQI